MKTFVKYEDTLTEVTLYEINQNLITFSEEGKAVVESLFIRVYDEIDTDSRIYVMREKGLREGTMVRFKYTEKQLLSLRDKAEEPLKSFYTHFISGGRWVQNIQGQILTYASAQKWMAPCPSRTKVGEEDTVEAHSFAVSGLNSGVVFPLEWIEPLSLKEQERYELKAKIQTVLSGRRNKMNAEKETLVHRLGEVQTEAIRLADSLHAFTARSVEDYVEKELNGMGRASEALSSDARVERIERNGEGLTVHTFFQFAVPQNDEYHDDSPEYNFTLKNGFQMEIPIGKLSILIRPNQNPYFTFKDRFHGADTYHPHQLGGGKLCYGDYSGAYSKAMAAKDYYTCFQIAIEVLTNINTHSQTKNTWQLIDAVLQNHGIESNYYDGDYVSCETDKEAAQEKLNQVTLSYGDTKVAPKKLDKRPKLQDKKLIASILKELNP